MYIDVASGCPRFTANAHYLCSLGDSSVPATKTEVGLLQLQDIIDWWTIVTRLNGNTSQTIS